MRKGNAGARKRRKKQGGPEAPANKRANTETLRFAPTEIRENSCNSWACFWPPRHQDTKVHQGFSVSFRVFCGQFILVLSITLVSVRPCCRFVRGPTSRFFAFLAATLFASKLPMPHHFFHTSDYRDGVQFFQNQEPGNKSAIFFAQGTISL